MPTYTAGPSPTSQPTFTPLPTYTAGPSPTPLPTYTAGPTPPRTNDPTLSQQALEFRLVANVDALLGTDTTQRNREQDRLRDAIRQQFAGLRGQRAGIVLTFGLAPTPAEGGRLSREINELLQDTLPDIFGGAVMRDFHNIQGDPALRGTVEMEVYVLVQP
ncbi:MAG: hypothetical protein HC837_00420 [Chloroflexaceae bacterium]|nr:hypothetical protein [Chloroflexaceae bacterium]